jgi:hypothetical protein
MPMEGFEGADAPDNAMMSLLKSIKADITSRANKFEAQFEAQAKQLAALSRGQGFLVEGQAR